jgi:dUTP pyrophosphatase
MKLKIKKLHPDAVIPRYQTKGASGFDLHALEDTDISPGQTILVKTGLSVAVQEGFELQVRPRSGMSLKTYMRVANAPGTVDSDYRGEVCVIMTNTISIEELVKRGEGYNKYCQIKKGDRIAQGVICPVLQVEFEEVEELDETQRGAGRYGSTGNK